MILLIFKNAIHELCRTKRVILLSPGQACLILTTLIPSRAFHAALRRFGASAACWGRARCLLSRTWDTAIDSRLFCRILEYCGEFISRWVQWYYQLSSCSHREGVRGDLTVSVPVGRSPFHFATRYFLHSFTVVRAQFHPFHPRRSELSYACSVSEEGSWEAREYYFPLWVFKVISTWLLL